MLSFAKERFCVSRNGPCNAWIAIFFSFFFLFRFYLFIFRQRRRREKERKRNVNAWLPLTRPLLGTWPATQACALTGNWTSNPLVPMSQLNTLSHTSQGWIAIFLSQATLHQDCFSSLCKKVIQEWVRSYFICLIWLVRLLRASKKKNRNTWGEICLLSYWKGLS